MIATPPQSLGDAANQGLYQSEKRIKSDTSRSKTYELSGGTEGRASRARRGRMSQDFVIAAARLHTQNPPLTHSCGRSPFGNDKIESTLVTTNAWQCQVIFSITGLYALLIVSYRNGLSPVESAFLAESIPILIQPRQAMTSLQLIDVCKSFLKRQRRVRIIPPTWLNPEVLQKLLEDEEQKANFAALPDFSRRLLRDLQEIRQAKARKGIETVGETHVQMDNIEMMKINEIWFNMQAADQIKLLNVAKLDRDVAGELESNDQFE
jgi:hypothetical protein